MKLDTVLEHYVTCALWSSHDNMCRCDENKPQLAPCGEAGCGAETGGAPMDDNYGPDDIASESLSAMRHDCRDFIAYCTEQGLLEAYPHSEEQLGHDFWLTRNGHGAGFWDRGDGELGDALSKAAKTFGGSDLYVGNDGKVHTS